VLHGEALCGLGRNRKLQLRHAEALACYEQALPLVRGTRTRYVEAVVEANLSQLNARLGRHQDALDHAERELVLHQDTGDTVGEAYALHDLATAWQGLGDYDTAAAFGERAVAIFRLAAATERYLAAALETTAESLVGRGDLTRATACLEEAAAILEELGDSRADAIQRRALVLNSSATAGAPA
jgi:tetratricopeptide (TPR) repeat protein